MRRHAAQRLRHAVRERLHLALHRTRDVEHVRVVGAVHQWLQVDAGRHHHHERPRLVLGSSIRDDLDAARQVVGEAVVEDEVARQRRTRLVQRHPIRARVELAHDRGRLEARHPDVVDRPGRFQLDVDREAALHLRVGRPETLRHLIGAAVLERVHVAADAGIDFERLIIDEPELHLGVGADRRDPELVGQETILRRQSGIVPRLAFLRVGGLGLGLRPHFALECLLARHDRDLGKAGALRHRKSVDRLEVLRVWIEERLQHLRLGEAVVEGDVHLVGTRLHRGGRAADRSERARRVSRGQGGEAEGAEGAKQE